MGGRRKNKSTRLISISRPRGVKEEGGGGRIGAVVKERRRRRDASSVSSWLFLTWVLRLCVLCDVCSQPQGCTV